MPRMFDILRGKMDFPKKNSPNEPAPEEKQREDINFPRQIGDDPAGSRDKKQLSGIRFSRKLIDSVKNKGIDNGQIAKEKYSNMLGAAKILLNKIERKNDIDSWMESIYDIVDTVTNQLILGNSLLENVTKNYETKDYLPHHTVNVCILSLAIGLQMNFNKSRLHILGMAAMLHDIGLLEVKNIINLPRKLSEAEFEEVKKHSLRGAEMVSELGERFKELEDIIAQHHERNDGSGYPSKIKGSDINIYAKIIGLVDTYEAMIHNRPYPGLRSPHRALREILASLNSLFEPEIIKALVEKISIYPLGSFVKLSNGETAKVISSNFTSPLRPVVVVVLDEYGRHLKKSRTEDLAKEDNIYIIEPVSTLK